MLRLLLRGRGLVAACLLLLLAGCDAVVDSGIATFSGTVVDAVSQAPIAGALVAVQGTGVSTLTNGAGAFELSVDADSTGQRFTLDISAEDYAPQSLVVVAIVDQNVPLPRIGLGLEDGSGGPTGPSGPAASITLADRTSEAIGVSGAGAAETTTLNFVVLDGNGRPVGSSNPVDLTFSIGNGPDGGESIEPSTARTNARGEAEVTLTSGTRAGTVQLIAATTVDGRTIRSTPVTVTITGGLPDAAHFSVAPSQLNFAGYNRFGLQDEITAYVGDKYGNPVQPGTAVYFTTDGGIVGGSGVTNAAGTTTVALTSAAPLPSNPFNCGADNTDPRGYAVVRARTSDENQQSIEASTPVLFSGVTSIEITTAGLDLGSFTYHVADQFGHPLAPGTSVSVQADGTNVKAVGDVSFQLGDFLCPGTGRTRFTFSVVPATSDDQSESEPPVLETISITVTGPNGNARYTRSALLGHPVEGRLEDAFERLD